VLLPQELLKVGRVAAFKDVVRRAIGFHFALMEKDYPAGDVTGEAHFMGNDKHRTSFFS
jgi:hypothetical protein